MRIIDSIIALRIVYLLTVPFEKTEAFKLGLIDAAGGKLKNAQTSAEKDATSMLHRLVWNIKKVFALIPGGKTRLGSLAAAYMLVRESYEQKMSEEDSLKYVIENIERVWGLPFEEKEWVMDALSVLDEDAAANATGGAVSTDTPTVKKGKRFAEFQVDDDTFGKFKNGKAKYRRWATYLNLEDTTHKQIYEFAMKNHKGIIVLKDSKGTLKGIRYSRRGSGNWANIHRKPRSIVESVGTDEMSVHEIKL